MTETHVNLPLTKVLDVGWDLRRDVARWLREEAKSFKSYEIDTDEDDLSDLLKLVVVFKFQDSTEATLFKLTFG